MNDSYDGNESEEIPVSNETEESSTVNSEASAYEGETKSSFSFESVTESSLVSKEGDRASSTTESAVATSESSKVSAYQGDGTIDTRSGKISLDFQDAKYDSSLEKETAKQEIPEVVMKSAEKPSGHPENSYVIIDGQRFRTDDRGNIHMYYDKDSKNWNMMPNAEYELNGYRYMTDANGSIIHAEGKLHLNDERRALNDNIDGKKEGDDRGHIIADRFDGSNHRDNLIPQLSELNRGEYKKMENMLADAVVENKDVQVSYDLKYSDDPMRPDYITVKYSIDGEYGERTFDNRFDNRRNA